METLCQAAGLPPPITDSLCFSPGAAAYGLYGTADTLVLVAQLKPEQSSFKDTALPKPAYLPGNHPAHSLPVCLSVPILPSSRHRDDPLAGTQAATHSHSHACAHAHPATHADTVLSRAHAGTASHQRTAVCRGCATPGAAAGSAGSCHVPSSPENSLPFPQPDNYKVQNSKPSEYTIL